KLAEAAKIIAAEPVTLQLRYLQTATEIGRDKNTTILFPLPMEFINVLSNLVNKNKN
ncbi:MAG TPA: slipin family protein, partial [Elusimicrobiota bacterium]|nr:slipin family protein [Elusimicrobiota bacterium]